MKSPPFEYHEPRTVEDAVAALTPAGRDCSVLAGGQSLLPLLNLRRVRPDAVVDINRVAGLDGIRITADAVRIGALARLRTLERVPSLREALPILPETAALVAYPQIRTRSTLGGCLCQADPAAELPALAVALGARLHLRSAQGSRTVDADMFFRSASVTLRDPGELLAEIEFARHRSFRFCFEEVTRGGGFPLVGLCFGVATDGDGVVTAARLAGAGVADRPLRLRAAEQALIARTLSDDLGDVLDAASAELAAPSDIHGTAAYRRGLVRALLRRATARLATGRIKG
ncbi:MAG: FAD binding domain-containing protein [Candidatus Dormibacteria bacterium]